MTLGRSCLIASSTSSSNHTPSPSGDADALAVVFGASKWPKCRALEKLRSCKISAERFRGYLDRKNGFGLIAFH